MCHVYFNVYSAYPLWIGIRVISPCTLGNRRSIFTTGRRIYTRGIDDWFQLRGFPEAKQPPLCAYHHQPSEYSAVSRVTNRLAPHLIPPFFRRKHLTEKIYFAAHLMMFLWLSARNRDSSRGASTILLPMLTLIFHNFETRPYSKFFREIVDWHHSTGNTRCDTRRHGGGCGRPW